MSVSRSVLFRLATSARFERIVRAVPQGERRAWTAAARYVAGTAVDDARQTASQFDQRGVSSSIDQFGESVTDRQDAEQVATDYLQLAADLTTFPESTWLSIDLSHLGLDTGPGRCAEHLRAIAAALPTGRRIQVGAEDCAHAEAILNCVLSAAGEGYHDRLGATIQANLRRSPDDLERLAAAGVHIRLVKGAYVESSRLALPYGEPTDIAYLQLAQRLAGSGATFALATHDGVLREAALAALGPVPFEQLLGVRPSVLAELADRGCPVRVYVPFGNDWFRYWMRRLAESRGA